MNTLSVVTAVDPDRSEHLPATWASLVGQVLPDQWTWEWLVQCDGVDQAGQDRVRSLLPDDPRVSYGASRKGGPGIARTMTLARASGSLIKTLDADDRLTNVALARDVDALTNQGRGIGWAASRVVNDQDGTRTPHYPYDPPNGRIRSGSAYHAYTKEQYRILVHPATLCVRYPLLIALGGWMALPASEDTGLLMALDAIADGWFTAEAGMIYRLWAPQMSASAAHSDPDELGARRRLIIDRADALGVLMDGW
jgi:glycosyltransferase involved in cell wall biosynthesis